MRLPVPLLPFFLLIVPLAARGTPPEVTNVVAAQIEGTGIVEISYDVSDAEGDSVYVTLICSIDGGATFSLLPHTVSGDVNTELLPGDGKLITWDAATDYPGVYYPDVIAKVRATDGVALIGEMVFVPGGAFDMGDSGGDSNNRPVHTVNLDPFWIDKYEVTNAQFQVFLENGGYSTPAYWSADGWSWRLDNTVTQPAHFDSLYPGFPVRGVSWYEAEAFANFVGKRLPTEAEWEKAARGTDLRNFPWAGSLSSARANYLDSEDPYETTTVTTPVGFYDGHLHPSPPFQTIDSPGPYGAYDQCGNVWEWVQDWYSGTYYSTSPPDNPPGPPAGSQRVIRGGSAGHDEFSMFLRTWRRNYTTPGSRGTYHGFRCAKSGS